MSDSTTPGDGMTIPSEIRAFLEEMLKDAGMDNTAADIREEMVKELFARLDAYITTSIVEKLPAEQLEVFITMNEEKKPQKELDAFLRTNIPDADRFFAGVLIEFRDTYLGNSTAAKQIPEIINYPETKSNITAT